MEIEKRLLLIKYYEIYKSLLTEKKRNLFEDYYLEDLSINEIADNYGITKNAVYNSVKDSEKTLLKLEKDLKIYATYEYNLDLLKTNNIADSIIDQIK